MKTKLAKKPSESSVIMTQIVLPTHTNALNTVFGGTVMSWIDIAAAISAGRHAKEIVVTASIDAMHFISPIRIGQIVTIVAQVNYAGKTSMEVGVRVDSEDQFSSKRTHHVTAYTTFVAVNQEGSPIPVPPIKPETPQEMRRFEQALLRRKSRIELGEAIKRGPKSD